MKFSIDNPYENLHQYKILGYVCPLRNAEWTLQTTISKEVNTYAKFVL
jgi:hypothetical protein